MITAGLYQATSGRVLVGGREVNRPNHDVGMVFQRDVLLEWRTVLSNLLLPIEVKRRPGAGDEERARSLLQPAARRRGSIAWSTRSEGSF
jgi:NitT/TauT family transport system ATP-binding protein